jgi:hypothetical protein
MMIARGSKDGNELLLLGLSHENVARLVEGQPIHLLRITHGEGIPDGWEVIICVGKTEHDIVSTLKQAGVIDDMTNQNIDPRIKSP